VPPVAEMVMDPLLLPKQETFVKFVVNVGAVQFPSWISPKVVAPVIAAEVNVRVPMEG
jgi:hypothetical protein